MILVCASQQDYDGMAGKSGDEPAWTADEFAAMGAFMDTFNSSLADSGELVETRGLAAPIHTRRVQLRDGVPVVTDGPATVSTARPRSLRACPRALHRSRRGRARLPMCDPSTMGTQTPESDLPRGR